MHYEGDVSSIESATLLTISAVTLTGDSTNGYTVAVLDIDSDSLPEIDGDDYLLVRTARNSRFTDNFITDRTIFSVTKVERNFTFRGNTRHRSRKRHVTSAKRSIVRGDSGDYI